MKSRFGGLVALALYASSCSTNVVGQGALPENVYNPVSADEPQTNIPDNMAPEFTSNYESMEPSRSIDPVLYQRGRQVCKVPEDVSCENLVLIESLHGTLTGFECDNDQGWWGLHEPEYISSNGTSYIDCKEDGYVIDGEDTEIEAVVQSPYSLIISPSFGTSILLHSIQYCGEKYGKDKCR